MIQRPLFLYIACSVDGFIAPPDENLAFLDAVQRPGEDYGYAAFTRSIDTVIMGRRTYEKVARMGVPDPHPEKLTYVITRTPRADNGNIRFHSGDVIEFVRGLKQVHGAGIYCDGGAQLVHTLLEHGLMTKWSSRSSRSCSETASACSDADCPCAISH